MSPDRRLRVVVVDDSSVARAVLRRGLEGGLSFDVIGSAADGRGALSLIEAARPDGVVMDLEMPGLDGLATLEELARRGAALPSVLLAAPAGVDAGVEARARAAGAIAVVRKPPPMPSQEHAVRYVEEHVGGPLVRALRAGLPLPSRRADPVRGLHPFGSAAVHAVVVGASTGGPDAVESMLRQLGKELTVPVIVVQHIGLGLGRSLLDRFRAAAGVPVLDAADGTVVESGRVYLAAPGRHAEVVRTGEAVVLRTTLAAPEHFVRPSVDVLFRSAAPVWGRHLLAVVMTGMGEDGVAGCRMVKAAGGAVLVQDRASSVVWGMPGAVYAAGLAEGMMTPVQLAGAVQFRTTASLPVRAATGAGALP